MTEYYNEDFFIFVCIKLYKLKTFTGNIYCKAYFRDCSGGLGIKTAPLPMQGAWV